MIVSLSNIRRKHYTEENNLQKNNLELCRPTSKNPADFFTKPMRNAAQFREYRRIVMNIPDSAA